MTALWKEDFYCDCCPKIEGIYDIDYDKIGEGYLSEFKVEGWSGILVNRFNLFLYKWSSYGCHYLYLDYTGISGSYRPEEDYNPPSDYWFRNSTFEHGFSGTVVWDGIRHHHWNPYAHYFEPQAMINALDILNDLVMISSEYRDEQGTQGYTHKYDWDLGCLKIKKGDSWAD